MNPLLDFLTAKRVEHRPPGEHRHVRRGWIGVNPCPQCGSQSFHAAISEDGKSASCWRCGKLDPYALLVQLSNTSPREVVGILQAVRGQGAIPAPVSLTTGQYKEPPGIGPLLPVHRKYLRARGFNPNTIASLWSIGGIGLASRLPWRLFIPFTHRDRRVSWTTRAVGDKPGKRYISANPDEESTPHAELIYGEDYCRHTIIVVEGPADVWAIGPGAGAVCGLTVTDSQVNRIAAYPVRAVCFDGEPAAKLRQEALVRRLAPYPGETVSVDLETGNDPGAADTGEILELRREFLE